MTGGAGFIGANLARRLLEGGARVTILDDLSRPGSEGNLRWLRRWGRPRVVVGDISRPRTVERAVSAAGRLDLVFHAAAQVAVTTSVADPRRDFEVNALGTFNLLEALRGGHRRPFLIFASTNKVYGELGGSPAVIRTGRYTLPALPHGVSERHPLDFHSPYGCSKGAADQYVRDYSRIYGIPSVVFRQSCIYGERQLGMEDQGWVAWFTIAAVLGRPLTVYGDGRQVRDVLWMDDLVEAVLLAYRRRATTAGRVYNIGGGPGRTLSLVELLDWLGRRLGRRVRAGRAGWRPGDQRVYISDIRLARKEFGWSPRTTVNEGLTRLLAWVLAHRADCERALRSSG